MILRALNFENFVQQGSRFERETYRRGLKCAIRTEQLNSFRPTKQWQGVALVSKQPDSHRASFNKKRTRRLYKISRKCRCRPRIKELTKACSSQSARGKVRHTVELRVLPSPEKKTRKRSKSRESDLRPPELLNRIRLASRGPGLRAHLS